MMDVTSVSSVEYRSVIRYLLIRGFANGDILKELSLAYGSKAPSRTTAYFWISEFKRGRQSVEQDFSTVGRPQEIPEEKSSQCDEVITAHRRITIRELSRELRISYHSCHDIIERLGYRKLASRFVPKFLSPEMKENRLLAAQSNLDLLEMHGDQFLNCILTEDETPLSLYLPQSKRESAEWRKSGESAPLKMRSGTSHRRSLMLTVFWNASGIQLVDFADKGVRINSEYYSNLLSEARKKIRKPRNIPLYLLHDNAPIHTSQETTNALTRNGFQLLSHPPYSPDLAPSDFYLFRFLKKHLRGHHFESPVELRDAVTEFFDSLTPEFFHKAFCELRLRWQKVTNANGSYIEK